MKLVYKSIKYSRSILLVHKPIPKDILNITTKHKYVSDCLLSYIKKEIQ